MNEEIRPNTFIKSYYDGLVIVFPDSVVLIAITGNYIYITQYFFKELYYVYLQSWVKS